MKYLPIQKLIIDQILYKAASCCDQYDEIMSKNKEYKKTYEKYVPYKKLNEENFGFLHPEDNQPKPDPIPIVQTNKKMILDR